MTKRLDRAVSIVLLDIEGTICPISFVKEVMYPASYTILSSQLASSPNYPPAALEPYLPAFAAEHTKDSTALLTHVSSLISTDSKASEFKALQGHLWRTGFEDGTLRSPLFPDVLPTLRKWKSENLQLAIFSSGSVPAQKLFLGHVAVNDGEEQGKKSEDVNGLLSGNFDTVNAGPKMEKESYEKIAKELGVDTKEVFFLSDNVKEVRAAIEAGMASFVVDRPGNAPLTDEDRNQLIVIKSLEDVELA